jgi:hypothetical protein
MSGSDFTMSVSGITTNHAACGATVLERILLAIIDAHTSCENDGQQAKRLEAALLALVGPPRRNQGEMDKALLFMVQQRRRDICDFELGAVLTRPNGTLSAARPISELASLAARDVMGSSDANEIQAAARVLCSTYRKWGREQAGEHDHVREALENEAVERFCDELAEWDVPTKL